MSGKRRCSSPDGLTEHAVPIISELARGYVELEQHIGDRVETAQHELNVALRPARDKGERVLTARDDD